MRQIQNPGSRSGTEVHDAMQSTDEKDMRCRGQTQLPTGPSCRKSFFEEKIRSAIATENFVAQSGKGDAVLGAFGAKVCGRGMIDEDPDSESSPVGWDSPVI